MTAVAGAVGAPSGSMYHRFASRDEMLARLWLRTIGEFQTGFVDALSDADTTAAIDAAVAFVFDWTAANPTKSALLLQFDEKAIVDAWPQTWPPTCLRRTTLSAKHFGSSRTITWGRRASPTSTA